MGFWSISSWNLGQDTTVPLKTETFNVSDIEATLNYYDTEMIPFDSQIRDVVSSAFPIVTEFFGGLPKDLPGRDYTKFVINLRYGPPVGEADPQVIDFQFNEEIQDEPFFGYITWQMGLIHELVHFWNAETFRRSSYKEQWFNEGVTEYYALKTATRLGIIEESRIPTILALTLGHFLTDPGIGTFPMSEAGAPETKGEHYFLVYFGGLAAGVLLDYDVRATTNNTKTLDDLMRVMYLKYNRSDRRYTNSDIAAELKVLAGKDYSTFFARHIEGPEILPVGQSFSIRDLYLLNTAGRSDSAQPKGDPTILKEMFHID